MRIFTAFYHQFISERTTRETKRLAFATAILNFAATAVGLFEPVYLITIGYSLLQVMLFYLAGYALMLLLYPLGARFAVTFGAHRGILLASPFMIAYYLALFAMKSNALFLPLALVMFAIYRTLYWPNFHLAQARGGTEGERGRDLSSLDAFAFSAAVLGPIFGGAIVGAYGFPALFVSVSLLILVSNLPLMTIPEVREKEGPSWAQAFRNLLRRDRLRLGLASAGYGEELIGMAVWPIFIYVTLKNFATIGAVVSLGLLAAVAAMLYIGRLADRQSRHALVRTGAIFTLGAWVSRMFVLTPIGVLGSNAFYNISRELFGVPFMSIVYGESKDGPVLDTIMYFEMWLIFGKVVTAALAVALLLIFPGSYIVLFALAAAFSLLYTTLR